MRCTKALYNGSVTTYGSASYPVHHYKFPSTMSLKLMDAPVSALGIVEVLVHMKATCICGSNIYLWKTGWISGARKRLDYQPRGFGNCLAMWRGYGPSEGWFLYCEITVCKLLTYSEQAIQWPWSLLFPVRIASCATRDRTIFARTSIHPAIQGPSRQVAT